MVVFITMKHDVNANIIPWVEIVRCAIQRIMMHRGNRLVLLIHMHAKVCRLRILDQCLIILI